MIPDSAVGMNTDRNDRQRSMPSARVPSSMRRSVSRSSSSEATTITGSSMTARATAPAKPEKCPVVTTTSE